MKYLIPLTSLILWSLPGLADPAELQPACYIKPCDLKGDFDRDGKVDRAFLVQNKAGKRGIEFKLSKAGTKFIGAGKDIGNGGDDFNWMDRWTINKEPIGQGATEKRPPKFKGDSLLLEQTMSASGIVFWNGTDFEWYQQGD